MRRKVKILRLPNKAEGGANPFIPGNSNDSALNMLGAPTGGVNNTLPPVPVGEANLEAEKNEQAVTNLNGDGIPENYKVGGKRHNAGGTPLNLPTESFIFSDTKSMIIKDEDILDEFGMPKKKKGSKGFTPAEIAKKYDLNNFKKQLLDPDSTDLQRETAEKMITNYNLKLSKLALVQESMKGFPDGMPGIAMPYLMMAGVDPQMFLPQDQQAEMEENPTQEMRMPPEEVMMRYGGGMQGKSIKRIEPSNVEYYKNGGRFKLPQHQLVGEVSNKTMKKYGYQNAPTEWLNTELGFQRDEFLNKQQYWQGTPVNPTDSVYTSPGGGQYQITPENLSDDLYIIDANGNKVLKSDLLYDMSAKGKSMQAQKRSSRKKAKFQLGAGVGGNGSDDLIWIPEVGQYVHKSYLQNQNPGVRDTIKSNLQMGGVPMVDVGESQQALRDRIHNQIWDTYDELMSRSDLPVAKFGGPTKLKRFIPRAQEGTEVTEDYFTDWENAFRANADESYQAWLKKRDMSDNSQNWQEFKQEVQVTNPKDYSKWGKKADQGKTPSNFGQNVKEKVDNTISGKKTPVGGGNGSPTVYFEMPIFEPGSPGKNQKKQAPDGSVWIMEGNKKPIMISGPNQGVDNNGQVAPLEVETSTTTTSKYNIPENAIVITEGTDNWEKNARSNFTTDGAPVYIEKADGSYKKVTSLKSPTTEYDKEDPTYQRMGQYAGEFATMKKMITENEDFQDAIYKEYLNQYETYSGKMGPKLDRQGVIDNFLTSQEQIYAIREGIEEKEALDPSWDSKSSNEKYNEIAKELGFEPMNREQIATFQGTYAGIVGLSDPEKYPEYASIFEDYDVSPVGLGDENFLDREDISPIDAVFGNTTQGQWFRPKATELGLEDVDPDIEEVVSDPESPDYKPGEGRDEFWLQDIIKTAGAFGDLHRIKKYMPWSRDVDVHIPDPTFYDPSRQIANINEQYGVAADTMQSFAGPQATRAGISSLQGNALAQAANVIGQYDNMNVGVANQNASQVAGLLNAADQMQFQRDKTLFDETTIANQQYDNSKNLGRQNLRQSYIDAITNKKMAQAMNTLYPQYETRPGVGGGLYFTDGRPLTDTGSSGDGDYMSKWRQLKTMYPEADDATLRAAMTGQYPNSGGGSGNDYQAGQDFINMHQGVGGPGGGYQG